MQRFLSTPSGWRATKDLIRAKLEQIVSIHALRVEGDWRRGKSFASGLHFYPRPPGGGRPRALSTQIALVMTFLSTPSGWRATVRDWATLSTLLYFYPRPPGGGRPVGVETLPPDKLISIHALRVEGDAPKSRCSSSLPRISIHALRVEGDLPQSPRSSTRSISIHALRVEGDGVSGCDSQCGPISIHALRVEGDLETCRSTFKISNFYPRPPGGRRRPAFRRPARRDYFYPRPPGGRRQDHKVVEAGKRNFYPRPPGGRRRLYSPSWQPPSRFLSTPSGWKATSASKSIVEKSINFYPRPPGGRRH